MIKKTLIFILLFSFSFYLFAESENSKDDFVGNSVEEAESDSELQDEELENYLETLAEAEESENKESDENAEKEKNQTSDTEENSDNDENPETESDTETPDTDTTENSSSNDADSEEKDSETDKNSEDAAPAITRKELTISGADRPEVEKFRKMYLESKGEKQLTSALENGITYRLYVRHALSEKEMPPELEYLPVVESNYKASAKSKSGAVGLWQFMANSVKPFLTLNDYVDERYDPWKSTEAALKKLSDNYNYFHDWPLAIAAYNCGMGALSKALAKSPVKDFWYLAEHKYIPTQTALYVPKLLAIADLAINSEYYGINLPSHDEEYEALYNEKNGIFDYITVKKAYSLNQLAGEMRIDESLLKQLNPAYILGFTHPSNESKIRLPLGMEKTAQEAIAKIKPIDFPVKYKVVSGDSLWSISRKYGTTVSAICELNGINENDILRIGKILYIPSK